MVLLYSILHIIKIQSLPQRSYSLSVKSKGNVERIQHSLGRGERDRNLVHPHCLTLTPKCYCNTFIKYRFREQSRWGLQKITWSNLLWKGSLDEVTEEPVQSQLENLHGWGLYMVPGKVVPVNDCSHSKKICGSKRVHSESPPHPPSSSSMATLVLRPYENHHKSHLKS